MKELDCWIYKSPRKEEMYLYVAAAEDFSQVPEALLSHFGEPIFVMQLVLSPDRPLARAEVEDVITQLGERGFYLQMPPQHESSVKN